MTLHRPVCLLFLPHPPKYLAHDAPQPASFLFLRLLTHNHPALRQAREMFSQCSLPSHLLSCSPALLPAESPSSSQGSPYITVQTGCTHLAPWAMSLTDASLLFCGFYCLSPPWENGFSRVGPRHRQFLSLEPSLVLAHGGLLRNTFHSNKILMRFVFPHL